MNTLPKYFLFLDDEREPPEIMADRFVVVRSFDEAVKFVETLRCPALISFDHDLGEGKTGYDFAKWLVEKDMDMDGKFIPSTFNFVVHSQNPVGEKNIQSYISNYLRIRNDN